MHIFLTGAAGFIGSRIARRLLDRGHRVTALLRHGDPRQRIADIAHRMRLLEGDLGREETYAPLLREDRPDSIIHMAWYVEPGKYLTAIPENIESLHNSLRLAHIAAGSGCPHFAAAGTCAEYRMDESPLTEEGPLNPDTVYAAAKHAFQITAQRIAAQAGFRFAWGRIFYLYGPGEDERRMTPQVIRTLNNGIALPASPGEQVRDYLHVDDVAAAFVIMAETRAEGIYNVSSGRPITIRQFMETVQRLMGGRGVLQFGALPYRPWDPMFICGDHRKLSSLGWEPSFDLDSGLRDMIRSLNCEGTT